MATQCSPCVSASGRTKARVRTDPDPCSPSMSREDPGGPHTQQLACEAERVAARRLVMTERWPQRTNHDQAVRISRRSGLAMVAAYLTGLNPEQRRAVAHGIAARGSKVAAPLLVIA